MTERQAKIAAMYIDEIMAEMESMTELVAAGRHAYDPGGSRAYQEEMILADLGFIERRLENVASLTAQASSDVIAAHKPKLRVVSER